MPFALTAPALLGLLAFGPPHGKAQPLELRVEFPADARPSAGDEIEGTLRCPDRKSTSVTKFEIVMEMDDEAFGRADLEGPSGERCVVEVSVGSQILRTSIEFAGHGIEHAKLTPVLEGEHGSSLESTYDLSGSRDFTAVVDLAPAAGISLAGTTGATTSEFQAGTLTAAAVDDLARPRAFADFARHNGPVSVQSKFGTTWAAVRVVDRRKRPVRGVAIAVGQRTLRTRGDGRAVFLGGWDGISQLDQARAQLIGGPSVALRAGRSVDVVVDDWGPRADAVDLLLMVDVTGSMGDELSYLQVELAAILERLERKHANLDLRLALVLYRDDGDEFVVRGLDFTRDFGRFDAVLARQSAGGGGDMPEAVHTAFQTANEMSWRGPRAASRLVVHVADAPPHEEHMLAALRAVDELRTKGTAIYPVAASGVDAAGEFFMRGAALMSGGQYVFLTDDSGYGHSHREATASCFQVDSLASVLGNILDAEVTGQRPSLPAQGRREGGDACKSAKVGAKVGHRGLRLGPLSQPGPGNRPGIPRRAPASVHSDLSRSLFDDDAGARFHHRPYVRHGLN